MGKVITTGTIDEVIRLLEQEYGPRQWKADGDPVTVVNSNNHHKTKSLWK
jgi:hypothetical protein